jgi:hypothetical protein
MPADLITLTHFSVRLARTVHEISTATISASGSGCCPRSCVPAIRSRTRLSAEARALDCALRARGRVRYLCAIDRRFFADTFAVLRLLMFGTSFPQHELAEAAKGRFLNAGRDQETDSHFTADPGMPVW